MIGAKGNGMGAPQAQPGGMFSRGQGGILPERGSQLQYDMVNSLVQSAMASAGRSNSPLLAALTPLIGGALMSRTTGLRDAARQHAEGSALEGMYGKLTPEQQRLYQASNDETLPDFMRADARRRLQAALGISSGTGTGTGSSGSGTGVGQAPVDISQVLFDLQSGGSLNGAQQRYLVEMMTSGESAQQREWAQALLEMNDENIRNGAPVFNPGAAPAVGTQTPTQPQAPQVPQLQVPAMPASAPAAAGTPPPPPPGTVPY